MHEAEAQGHLSGLIEAVVRQEGPVHEERVLTTIRTAWGISRSGTRVRDAFNRAVTSLARGSLDRDRSGFLRGREAALDAVRVPVADDEDTSGRSSTCPGGTAAGGRQVHRGRAPDHPRGVDHQGGPAVRLGTPGAGHPRRAGGRRRRAPGRRLGFRGR
ncbi:DUF3320 domain-containing protein [Actinosynnema sp. CA-299493]